MVFPWITFDCLAKVYHKAKDDEGFMQETACGREINNFGIYHVLRPRQPRGIRMCKNCKAIKMDGGE